LRELRRTAKNLLQATRRIQHLIKSVALAGRVTYHLHLVQDNHPRDKAKGQAAHQAHDTHEVTIAYSLHDIHVHRFRARYRQHPGPSNHHKQSSAVTSYSTINNPQSNQDNLLIRKNIILYYATYNSTSSLSSSTCRSSSDSK